MLRAFREHFHNYTLEVFQLCVHFVPPSTLMRMQEKADLQGGGFSALCTFRTDLAGLTFLAHSQLVVV